MQTGSEMGSQRFCLRWNNHQTNLLSVFDQLLHDEAFVDVTLAVEGQFLRAHKMVLSACSPYFQALFVGHPDKHPIVILKDVPYSDMRSLLDFMYRGEVSVDQDRLTAFLKVAESLRIKGLTEVNEERCDLPSIANSLLNQTFTPPPPPPPPSLHRLQQHSIPAAPPGQAKPVRPPPNPMLNSALTAPKRKRGRPRKLSGSSPNPPPISHPDVDHDEQKPPVAGAPLENHLGVQFSPVSVQQQPHAPQGNSLPLPQEIAFRSCLTSAGHPPGVPQCNNTSAPPSSNPPTSSIEESFSPKIEDEDEDCEDLSKMEDGEDDGGLDEEEPPDPTHPTPKSEDPKPSTSGQDSLASFQSSTQSDGERFSSSEECLQSVSVSICEDVSITPFPVRGNSSLHEEVAISPVDDVTLNPVQFAPHFLSHEALLQVKEESAEDTEDDSPGATPPRRRDLLEYLMNEDGTVVCKRCGELLPSRTQWYRHKYKFHIESQPAALFKCYRCNVFFKSRKGYLGHLSTRHSRIEERVVIPCRRGRRSSEDVPGNPEEYEKQREKEEKLVADIIDRVKRECEAQGSTVTRKGYSRRSTIMNT